MIGDIDLDLAGERIDAFRHEAMDLGEHDQTCYDPHRSRTADN